MRRKLLSAPRLNYLRISPLRKTRTVTRRPRLAPRVCISASPVRGVLRFVPNARNPFFGFYPFRQKTFTNACFIDFLSVGNL